MTGRLIEEVARGGREARVRLDPLLRTLQGAEVRVANPVMGAAQVDEIIAESVLAVMHEAVSRG